VWLNLVDLREGEGGSAIYAGTANWAHNTGRVLVGDPSGLSDVAMPRRLEAMLSSAIKFRTTDHLEPHPTQLTGLPEQGLPAIKWRAGDTAANIASMIHASIFNVYDNIDGIDEVRYDFGTHDFRDQFSGERWGDARFAEVAGSEGGRAARAGGATIKRAVLLESLVRPASGERAGLLDQLSSLDVQSLDPQLLGIFYSRAPQQTSQEAPAQSAQDDASADQRYSRSARNISDIDTILRTKRMAASEPTSTLADKLVTLVTLFTDSTRPWAVFVERMAGLDAQARQDILVATDLAPGRRSATEGRFMKDHGRAISAGVAEVARAGGMDFAAAKEVLGHWMAARYAPVANAWLMKKDGDAVAAAQAELSAARPASAQAKARELARVQGIQAARANNINGAVRDPSASPYASDVGVAGGYNNATAADQRKKIEAVVPADVLTRAAAPVYAMLRDKTELDMGSGKVTQAMVDAWPGSELYVPLTGDPRAAHDVADEDPVFSGASVNQAKDKQLKGRSTTIAQNAVDAAFEAVRRSAAYDAWSPMKSHLHDAYESELARMIQSGQTQAAAVAALGERWGVSRTPDNMAADRDAIIYRPGGGQAWAYRLNDQAAVEAIRSANKEPIPTTFKAPAVASRLFARLVTQYSLGFAPANAVRDVWEKTENLRARSLPGVDMNAAARAAVGYAIRPDTWHASFAAAARELRAGPAGAPVNSAESDLRDLINAGGISTWGEFLAGQSVDLSKQLGRESGWRKLPVATQRAIEAYNNGFEMISSLSIYRGLLGQGVQKTLAARTTLELMNFRKGGTLMGPVRALYVFAQPILTGAHQLGRTLSTKRGQARLLSYAALGMLLFSALREGEDDDETGRNRIDELGNWTLERSIPVPVGDEILKVPVGFGLPQFAWGLAANLVKYLNGAQSGAETLGELLKIGGKTISPVAPSETSMVSAPGTWVAQTATPTILRPVANVILDRTAFGAALTKSRFEKSDKPRAMQGRETTAPEWRQMAFELAKAGGPDMYPEQLRELAMGYLVGPLRDVVVGDIERANRQAQGRPTVSPWLTRWVAAKDDVGMRQRLYLRAEENAYGAARQTALQTEGVSAGDEDSGDAERRRKLTALAKDMKKMDSSIAGMRAAATKRKLSDEARADEHKRIDAVRNGRQLELLRRYYGIMKNDD
jgi:hypothetical protein